MTHSHSDFSKHLIQPSPHLHTPPDRDKALIQCHQENCQKHREGSPRFGVLAPQGLCWLLDEVHRHDGHPESAELQCFRWSTGCPCETPTALVAMAISREPVVGKLQLGFATDENRVALNCPCLSNGWIWYYQSLWAVMVAKCILWIHSAWLQQTPCLQLIVGPSLGRVLCQRSECVDDVIPSQERRQSLLKCFIH